MTHSTTRDIEETRTMLSQGLRPAIQLRCSISLWIRLMYIYHQEECKIATDLMSQHELMISSIGVKLAEYCHHENMGSLS